MGWQRALAALEESITPSTAVRPLRVDLSNARDRERCGGGEGRAPRQTRVEAAYSMVGEVTE